MSDEEEDLDSSDKRSVAGGSDAMFRELHIPDFLPTRQLLDSPKEAQQLAQEIRKKGEEDWLTPELLEEIALCAPKGEKEMNPSTGKRDLEAFMVKAERLFPKGRLFASSIQLDFAVKAFLRTWCLAKRFYTKSFVCEYCKPMKKKDRPATTTDSAAFRESIQCPFIIRFSHYQMVKKHGKPVLPETLYQVKITACNYKHTCFDLAPFPITEKLPTPHFLPLTIPVPADVAGKKQFLDEYRKKDWLTDELKEEIAKFYPSDEEKDPTTGQRDLEAFKTKAAKLFPVGRAFVGPVQLYQALEIFLEEWAVRRVISTKRILCAYAEPIDGDRSTVPMHLKRKVERSPKKMIKCPFHIQFGFRRDRENPMPEIFTKVIILSVDYNHTCGLLPAALLHAKHRAGCHMNAEEKKEYAKSRSFMKIGPSASVESVLKDTSADQPVDLSSLVAMNNPIHAADAQPELLPADKLPVWIPDFVTKTLPLENEEQFKLAEEWKGNDWLMKGLVEEMAMLYPDPSEKDPDTGQCNLSAFKEKAGRLFAKGRIFASMYQVQQAAASFLAAWNVCRAFHAKSVICFYSTTRKQKRPSQVEPSKRRRTKRSPKSIINCPFKITFSLVGVKHSDKLPIGFHKVKIVAANFEHTCGMTTKSFQDALSRSGKTAAKGKAPIVRYDHAYAVDRCNELCQIIQDKPKELQAVVDVIDTMIRRIQAQKPIKACFSDDVDTKDDKDHGDGSDDNDSNDYDDDDDDDDGEDTDNDVEVAVAGDDESNGTAEVIETSSVGDGHEDGVPINDLHHKPKTVVVPSAELEALPEQPEKQIPQRQEEQKQQDDEKTKGKRTSAVVDHQDNDDDR